LDERLDRMEARFGVLETKVDGLHVFASDAQRRLKRIETHLRLNGSSGRQPAARVGPPRRHKKP